MKKLLALTMILAMAGVANAALLISVDGVVDPPDTQVEITPSDEVVIDLWGDGATPPGTFYLGIGGPGTLDISGAIFPYAGSDTGAIWEDFTGSGLDEYIFAQTGLVVGGMMVNISLNDVPPPGDPKAPLDGTLMDGVLMHCEDLGDVALVITDGDGNVLDTQIIHQIIPEPMTVALLGLGGLFLRRRK